MNTAYPLVPISVITILAYFTTWLFSQWGIFSRTSFRKGWNYLLLITFLVTGLIGLFSVFKINYHLVVNGYDQLLRYHVSFGIAMVIIALFHFSWHLKYYFSVSLKHSEKPIESNEDTLGQGNPKVGYLLFLLGMVTVINQLVFIREFISVLAGNELIIGIVMSTWLLLTGWGAFVARNNGINLFRLKKAATVFIIITLLPVLLVGLLYWLKSQLFPPGIAVGLGISILGVSLLLFPVCFLSGYLFVSFTGIFSSGENKQLISKAYMLESLGSLAGGVFFSIVLGRFFNSFQIFGITIAISLLVVTYLILQGRKTWLWSLTGLLVPIVIFVFNPDKQIKGLLFPNQKIILNESTRYGNLTATEQAGQYNFYENNGLLFYTGNQLECEEAVHFAMLQHKNPKSVLLISGGIAGMISEIEKYPVERITYLELNPELLDRLKTIITTKDNDSKVVVVKEDIHAYLVSNDQHFDVILINLPPPSTLAFNRFYTDEFFRLIKKHCNSQTVVATSLPSTVNYPDENGLNVNASLWKTIGLHFTNQQLLLGEKNYFLASDEPVSSFIASLTDERGIKNSFVNHFYINDTLQIQRSQVLLSQFDRNIPVNRDFHPFMFLNQINQWLSLWKINYWFLLLVPLLLFIYFFFRLNPISVGLYTGGFTSGSLELVLLISYQLYFGTIYLSTALFFAIFMGGLAVGSSLNLVKGEVYSRKMFARLQFILALFAIVIPVFIISLDHFSNCRILLQILFFILVFILAYGIGREYRIASVLQRYDPLKTSGVNYSSDLLGSAFGAFLTTLILIPQAGIVITCLLVAGLNLISGNIAYFRQRS
jgi:spermidine synthase